MINCCCCLNYLCEFKRISKQYTAYQLCRGIFWKMALNKKLTAKYCSKRHTHYLLATECRCEAFYDDTFYSNWLNKFVWTRLKLSDNFHIHEYENFVFDALLRNIFTLQYTSLGTYSTFSFSLHIADQTSSLSFVGRTWLRQQTALQRLKVTRCLPGWFVRTCVAVTFWT